MYLLAALRDDGWFFWYPTGGQCNYGLDSTVPFDPLGTNGLYEGQPHSHDVPANHMSTGRGKDLESGGYSKSASSGSSSSGGASSGFGRVGVAILSGWVVLELTCSVLYQVLSSLAIGCESSILYICRVFSACCSAGWLAAGVRAVAYAPVALVQSLTGGGRAERQGLVGGRQ